ncbi:hypothetical protein SNEBB_004898 [Seison nebaliae]|nr:hypothetical protein SNEBB_004898 [Seison nebaliae]
MDSYEELNCTSFFYYLTSFGRRYKQQHPPLAIMLSGIGFIANILNLIILTRKRMRSSVTNVILIFLSIFDIITIVPYFISMIYEVTHPHLTNFTFDSYWWGVFFLFHNFITIWAHSTSIWTTVILAATRYITVRPRSTIVLDERIRRNINSKYKCCQFCRILSSTKWKDKGRVIAFHYSIFLKSIEIKTPKIAAIIVTCISILLLILCSCLPIIYTVRLAHDTNFQMANQLTTPISRILASQAIPWRQMNTSTITNYFTNFQNVYSTTIKMQMEQVESSQNVYKIDSRRVVASLFSVMLYVMSFGFKLGPCLLLTILSSLLVNILRQHTQKHRRLMNKSKEKCVQNLVINVPFSKESTSVVPTTNVSCREKERATNLYMERQNQYIHLPHLHFLLVRTDKYQNYLDSTTSRSKWRLWKNSTTSKSKRIKTDSVTPMLLAMVILFVITEVPQGLLLTAQVLSSGTGNQNCIGILYEELISFGEFLILFNCACNFPCYCIMSTQFRLEFFRICREWISCFRSCFPSHHSHYRRGTLGRIHEKSSTHISNSNNKHKPTFTSINSNNFNEENDDDIVRSHKHHMFWHDYRLFVVFSLTSKFFSIKKMSFFRFIYRLFNCCSKFRCSCCTNQKEMTAQLDNNSRNVMKLMKRLLTNDQDKKIIDNYLGKYGDMVMESEIIINPHSNLQMTEISDDSTNKMELKTIQWNSKKKIAMKQLINHNHSISETIAEENEMDECDETENLLKMDDMENRIDNVKVELNTCREHRTSSYQADESVKTSNCRNVSTQTHLCIMSKSSLQNKKSKKFQEISPICWSCYKRMFHVELEKCRQSSKNGLSTTHQMLHDKYINMFHKNSSLLSSEKPFVDDHCFKLAAKKVSPFTDLTLPFYMYAGSFKREKLRGIVTSANCSICRQETMPDRLANKPSDSDTFTLLDDRAEIERFRTIVDHFWPIPEMNERTIIEKIRLMSEGAKTICNGPIILNSKLQPQPAAFYDKGIYLPQTSNCEWYSVWSGLPDHFFIMEPTRMLMHLCGCRPCWLAKTIKFTDCDIFPINLIGLIETVRYVIKHQKVNLCTSQVCFGAIKQNENFRFGKSLTEMNKSLNLANIDECYISSRQLVKNPILIKKSFRLIDRVMSTPLKTVYLGINVYGPSTNLSFYHITIYKKMGVIRKYNGKFENSLQMQREIFQNKFYQSVTTPDDNRQTVRSSLPDIIEERLLGDGESITKLHNLFNSGTPEEFLKEYEKCYESNICFFLFEQFLWTEQDSNHAWFCTQAPECGSLGQLLERRESMPIDYIKHYTVLIIHALNYLHKNMSMGHFHLTPYAILVYGNGLIKLTDLEMCISCNDNDDRIDYITGIPGYQAPEQRWPHLFNGYWYYVDYFALACILYQMGFGGEQLIVSNSPSITTFLNTEAKVKLETDNLFYVNSDKSFYHFIRFLLHPFEESNPPRSNNDCHNENLLLNSRDKKQNNVYDRRLLKYDTFNENQRRITLTFDMVRHHPFIQESSINVRSATTTRLPSHLLLYLTRFRRKLKLRHFREEHPHVYTDGLQIISKKNSSGEVRKKRQSTFQFAMNYVDDPDMDIPPTVNRDFDDDSSSYDMSSNFQSLLMISEKSSNSSINSIISATEAEGEEKQLKRLYTNNLEKKLNNFLPQYIQIDIVDTTDPISSINGLIDEKSLLPYDLIFDPPQSIASAVRCKVEKQKLFENYLQEYFEEFPPQHVYSNVNLNFPKCITPLSRRLTKFLQVNPNSQLSLKQIEQMIKDDDDIIVLTDDYGDNDDDNDDDDNDDDDDDDDDDNDDNDDDVKEEKVEKGAEKNEVVKEKVKEEEEEKVPSKQINFIRHRTGQLITMATEENKKISPFVTTIERLVEQNVKDGDIEMKRFFEKQTTGRLLYRTMNRIVEKDDD